MERGKRQFKENDLKKKFLIVQAALYLGVSVGGFQYFVAIFKPSSFMKKLSESSVISFFGSFAASFSAISTRKSLVNSYQSAN